MRSPIVPLSLDLALFLPDLALGVLLLGMVGGATAAAPRPSLDELLRPMLGQAYGVARRLTGNEQDAEDLMQEACLLAVRGFAQFEAGTNFRAWFYRILHNAFCSSYRRERRRGGLVDIDDAPELFLYTRATELGLHGASPDPARVLLGRLQGEQVEAALDALPDEYREVCTLYFLDDLSYQDTAQALGIPVGTVRSRLHRGRRLLQKALWQAALDEGIVQQVQEGA